MTSETDDIKPSSDVTEEETIADVSYESNGSVVVVRRRRTDHNVIDDVTQHSVTSRKNSNRNNNVEEVGTPRILAFFDGEGDGATPAFGVEPGPRRFRIRDETTWSDDVTRRGARNPLLFCLPCQATFDSMTSFLEHVTPRHHVDSEALRKMSGREDVSSIVQKNANGEWKISYLETLEDDVMTLEENDVTDSAGTKHDSAENEESRKISQDSVINVVGQHKSVRNDDTPLVENVPEDPRKSEETSREIDENNSDHEGVLVLDLSKSPEENFESPCKGEKNFDAPCAMSFAVASPNPVVTNSSHPGRNGIMLGGIIREDRELKRGSILSPISNLQTGETEINNELRSPKSTPPPNQTIARYNEEFRNDNSVSSIANNVSDLMMINSTSSVDPSFPMSLFQSRNSCKTLKCPKCNWHYKYRQTLEAHMKEKHQEDTVDCVYCKSGQPHPRLSRGESYSCGYKPFKCNVCNYSTTTKGNLSIHMQSDKHLYNARNLQHRQHERIRQEVASSTFHIPRPNAAIDSTASSGNTTEGNKLINSQTPSPTTKPTNFEKSNLNSNSKRRKPATKLALTGDFTKTGGSRRETGSGGGKWRCDVCGYETAIARNLRIHMTSEKHAQNMTLMERGMLNVSRQDEDRSRIEQQRPKSPPQLGGLMDYYAAAFKSLHQQPDNSEVAMATSDDVDKARKAQAEYLQQQLFLAQQQQMILAQQYQQIMMAAAASSLQQRMTSSKDDVTKQLALQQAQMWKQLLPQSREDGSEVDLNSSRMFSCGLCGVFGTDDVAALEAHVRKPRHTDVGNDVMQNEWVTRTQRDGYFCRLCKYNTSLKTNFNLHCKTEKHTCKLNLIAHVREGSSATEWMISHVITGNITQSVSCNACQFVTHSLEKIKLHCTTEQHQGVYTVCQYLHSLKTNQGKENADAIFKCMACKKYSTKHIIEMVKHMQTSEHQMELQRHKNPPMTTLQDVVTVGFVEENQNTEQKSQNMDSEKPKENVENKSKHECEYCNYACDDRKRLQLHMMTQHNIQPPTQCPLCQEIMKDTLQLQRHLVQDHQLSAPKTEDKTVESKDTVESKGAFSHTDDQDTEPKTTPEENSSTDDVTKLKESEVSLANRDQETTRENDVTMPSNIVTSEAVSRSCPDLLTSVEQNSAAAESTSARPKRIRLRSCPLNGGSRSRTCRHLLSNYGLEQAIQYVENRSPQNKSKARHFRQEKREREWNMAVDEVDAARPKKEDENTAKSCQYCGKEFTGVWVLKAHEEVAHGVCVPAKKIQTIATAYSDQMMERFRELEAGSAADTKEEVVNRPLFDNQSQQKQVLIRALLDAQSSKQEDNKTSPYVNRPLFPEQLGTGEELISKNQLLQEEINQSQQKQALIRSLLDAQNNKQQEDNKTSSQLESLSQLYSSESHHGTMFNPMNMYSVLLQAQAVQAMGVNPYQQLLANAAVAQQMQQINSTNPMLHNIDDQMNGLQGSQLPHRGLELLQKQENSLKQMPAAPGMTQQTSNFEIPVKRPRTRITDDQLKILRANFDINNSPTEEQIDQMANRTTLPPKVIKHWFRNTLFKERQRSKDSPYNFNIPPITSLEDAFKPKSDDVIASKDDVIVQQQKSIDDAEPLVKKELNAPSELMTSAEMLKPAQNNREDKRAHQALFNNALSLMPSLSPPQTAMIRANESASAATREAGEKCEETPKNPNILANWGSLSVADNSISSNDILFYSPDNQVYLDGGMSGQGVCRRTPRTRFTDFQIQVLQEFFDRNAYPKDDDLDRLSQTLGLSTRVIVVWFQNARQKARKSYEQTHQPGGRFSPSLLAPTAGRINSPTVDDTIAKARSLTQNPSPNVEDLARKTLNEVSKSLAYKQEPSEAVKVIPDEPKMDEKMPEVPELEVIKAEPPVLSCQMCEATFQNVDEFQKHQQAHLVNMASVQYGLMYMQGLMGSPKQAEPQHDDVTKFQTPNRKVTSSNWNQSKASEESLQSFAAFQNGRLFSDDKTPSMVRSRLVTPPTMPGNLKRKISTSPTLSMSSSSSTSPASSGSRHKAMYLIDDKEQHHHHQKDPKRLRTTITPDQLEYLYQQYLVDSSPSRKIIEQISEMVGLKKRVVQVWFQNTRARERKGQFRSSVSRVSGGQPMAQYRFCQPCRMVFKSKVDLDMHMQSTHMQNIEGSEVNQPGNVNDEPATKKTKPTPSQPEVKKENMQPQNDFLALTYKPSVITSLSDATDLNNNASSQQEARAPNKTTYDVTSNSVSSDLLPQLELQKKFAAMYGSKAMPNNSGKPSDVVSVGETLAKPKSPKIEKFSFSEQQPTSYGSHYPSGDVTNIVDSSMTQYQQQMTSYASTSPSSTESSSMGNKRYRTQMTSGQVKALKCCFKICRTPSLGECENLGTEVGLPKRVIQVWFQNARAKEKRGKLPGENDSLFPQYSHDIHDIGTECDVCYPPYPYSSHHRAREHAFSRPHLQQLMKTMAYENQVVNENVWFSKSTGSVKSDVSTDDDLSRNSYKDSEPAKEECEVCMVRFNNRQEAQEHASSRDHLQQVVKNMERREQENRRVSPKIFELPTQTSAANQSTGSPSHVTPVYQSNEGMSQFNDANNGYDYKQARNEHEEIGSKSTDAVDQEPSSQMGEYASIINRNPALLQQAMQQIFANSTQQQQQEPAFHSDENKQQQAIQAFQKSIYQMLNLSQAGSTGSQ